jgi:hypothetical protein
MHIAIIMLLGNLLLISLQFSPLLPGCLCDLENSVQVVCTASISFVMSDCQSVCPHGTITLPLDGFSRNSIFEYYSQFCRENSNFINI